MNQAKQNNALETKPFFRPRRLAHVNLWVEDIARSEAFYRDTCGMVVEFTEPDIEATFLGVGHTQHDLGMMRTTHGENRYGRDGILQIPGTVGKTPGLNHVAWEVSNEAELVEAYRSMKSAGLAIDTTMDHQIAHSVYLFDPDGNYNEFYCDTTPRWRDVLHGEMGLITSRWDPEAAEGFTDSRVPVDYEVRRTSSAPLQPQRITHLVLMTNQPEAMFEFYSTVGGMSEVARHGAAVYLRGSLDAYDFGLVLVQGPHRAYSHASFELENEIALDRAMGQLRDRGADIVCVEDRPWKRSLFLRDPDGLLSEWYVARRGPRDLSALSSEAARFAA